MDPRTLPPQAIVAAGLVAIVLLLAQVAVTFVRRWWRRRVLAARFSRAAAGEAVAAELLCARGYAILGAQVSAEYPVSIDDTIVVVLLRADYVVEKDGARYVAEVKTGALAPKLETAATRRQLLEYRVAFDVDGVLLVDPEEGRVHEITFPRLAALAPPPRTSAAWAAVALAVGGAAAIAFFVLSS